MVTPYKYFIGLGHSLDQSAVDSVRPELGDILVADVRDQIHGSHKADGTPFAPLKYPRPDGGTGGPWFNTGTYLNSFTYAGMANGVALLSNHLGVMVHQHGATITAKRGKNLAIPLTAEAANSDGAKAMHGLFRIGKGLYESRGGTLIKHWLLVKRVVIPARPVGLSSEAKGMMMRAVVGAAIAQSRGQ